VSNGAPTDQLGGLSVTVKLDLLTCQRGYRAGAISSIFGNPA
jgi:hypothetical protein